MVQSKPICIMSVEEHPVVQGRTPLLGEEFRLQRIIRHPGNRECYRSLNKIELRAQNVCRSVLSEGILFHQTYPMYHLSSG
jgi:hypothetical protein